MHMGRVIFLFSWIEIGKKKNHVIQGFFILLS